MSSRRTTRTALAALALAVFGLVLAGLVAPATAATSTGQVKGVVSIAGQPVKNAKVQLYTHLRGDADDVAFAYDRVKTVSTDSRGRYSFTGVKTGTWRGGPKYLYAVLVSDRSGRGAKTVRYIKVTKNRTTTRSVTLKPAVVLTGSVARSDGGSPAELTVLLSSNEIRNDTDPRNEEFRTSSVTPVRSDGTFTVKGQAAGEFQVVVKGDAYLAQCYDFTTASLEECLNRPGTNIFLTAGERRVLAPVVATKPAPPVTTVAGTVTDTSGRALKGIGVSFSPSDGEGAPLTTRSSGRFTLKERLAPGTYLVRYQDPKGVWATQVRGASATSAEPIVVGENGVIANGITAKLRSRTTNRLTSKSGKGFIQMTFSLTRRASGGRPSGTMTITSDGRSATAAVKKGKVTVKLTGLSGSTHAVTATYSGTSNTAGFTRNFSPR